MSLPPAVAAGSSWLVPLADLSLILFVVTGAALAQQPVALPPASQDDGIQTGFVQTVPVAMLVDAPGAPPLDQWLDANGRDATGLVTIEGHFATEADRAAVLARVADLAQQARAAGVEPRMVVQPGTATEVVTVFAYDRDPEMARDLLENAHR